MKWIKVKDQVPEFHKELIFLNGKQEVTVGLCFGIEDENRVWIVDKLRDTNEIATYWMLLPNFPEESTDKK